ncbi:MAG: RNA methyltransferase [Bacteroidia bacterium]|nr:RNA methyltransferase [Bacteroidia bacterium]
MNLITSKDNPLFKKIIRLNKPKERRESKQFVIEGKKEIMMAIDNGIVISELIHEENAILNEKENKHFQSIAHQYQFSKALFSKASYREEHAECLAICQLPITNLDAITLSEDALIIVLESVEKPGNLGAILRTADGCGADAVIVCDEKTDFFNPNVIRSSVGTVFSVPKASATKEDVAKWLLSKNVQVFTTIIENALPYYQADFHQHCAIVLGTEATGLTSFWRQQHFTNIIVPMKGQNDSLNVSVAAAVIAFEARRQKTSIV